MGQKVHPIGFRLGIYRGWDARWYARPNKYGTLLIEDLAIRRFLEDYLKNADLAKVEIEKAGDNMRIVLHSGRPGGIIGKRGQGIETLRDALAATLPKGKNIDVSVQEIKKPEVDAQLVAKKIAADLENRGSYKRAMKNAALAAMRIGGVKGIKIRCAGRLNGAEIARAEWTRVGSIPLHTLRSDIDYGFWEAKTTYGLIGIKVWICKGDYQNIQ